MSDKEEQDEGSVSAGIRSRANEKKSMARFCCYFMKNYH